MIVEISFSIPTRIYNSFDNSPEVWNSQRARFLSRRPIPKLGRRVYRGSEVVANTYVLFGIFGYEIHSVVSHLFRTGD